MATGDTKSWVERVEGRDRKEERLCIRKKVGKRSDGSEGGAEGEW